MSNEKVIIKFSHYIVILQQRFIEEGRRRDFLSRELQLITPVILYVCTICNIQLSVEKIIFTDHVHFNEEINLHLSSIQASPFNSALDQRSCSDCGPKSKPLTEASPEF